MGDAFGSSAHQPLKQTVSTYLTVCFGQRLYTPVPIRLIPLVPAFVPQHLLKRPGIVPVPGQEVGCSVDRIRLLDVRYH